MIYLIDKIACIIRNNKIRKEKKYEEWQLLSKMYYIKDFINGKATHKVIDPELDLMIPLIKKLARQKYENEEITKSEYNDIKLGIKYHNNKNKELEKELIKEFDKRGVK